MPDFAATRAMAAATHKISSMKVCVYEASGGGGDLRSPNGGTPLVMKKIAMSKINSKAIWNQKKEKLKVENNPR